MTTTERFFAMSRGDLRLELEELYAEYVACLDEERLEEWPEFFTEDAVYDVDIGRMDGREAIRTMVRGERHQSMVGHCAHQIGPAVVELRGTDRAVATGYSRVYLETRAGIHIYRVSFNRWELVKEEGEWRIAHRTTRVLGNAEAQALFRTALSRDGGRAR